MWWRWHWLWLWLFSEFTPVIIPPGRMCPNVTVIFLPLSHKLWHNYGDNNHGDNNHGDKAVQANRSFLCSMLFHYEFLILGVRIPKWPNLGVRIPWWTNLGVCNAMHTLRRRCHLVGINVCDFCNQLWDGFTIEKIWRHVSKFRKYDIKFQNHRFCDVEPPTHS